ncbi:MAG: thioesterase family protein [Acidimicrobiales bacterium]
MSEFGDDTAVVRSGDGWAATINPRWNVGSAPSGGYLLALATNAMLGAAGRSDPLSVTAHFVRPPEPGPVAVATDVVRAGRRYATVAAELRQGGGDRVRLLGAFGDLDAQQGPTRVAAAPPDAPPPERCISPGWPSGASPDLARRYEFRFPPASPWLVRGDAPPDGEPLEVTGWIRLADGSAPSALALLAFSDAFPPTVLSMLDVRWVPTIELTVHVRARPAAGWVLGTFRTRFLIDGLMEEDGELWGENGRLLAHARQLALVLPR